MLGLLTLLFIDLRRDLTERAELLKRLAFESQHDSLTQVPNRRAFNEMLDQALALARRGERQVALLYLDLDGFKPINDQHGHAAGDATLKAVVARWQGLMREGEVLARLGGDEFAVIAAGDAGAVERLAQRLIEALDVSLLEQFPDVRVGVSVGLARYAEHGWQAVVATELEFYLFENSYENLRDGGLRIRHSRKVLGDGVDGNLVPEVSLRRLQETRSESWQQCGSASSRRGEAR